MKVMSRPKARTVTGAAKQAGSTVGDAQQQALDAIRDARKQARRQLVRARVAAARTRAGTQAKASKGSMKAVGVAGAAGLAAGYFLDPDSGKRRRHVARERALALIRRGAEPAADGQAPAEPVRSEEGELESVRDQRAM
jgi:hypothetical protein